jgi:nucleoside-diphosphate-sugar epimerase
MCTEYITPAVQGTLSVFNSTSKNGSSVKRVVLTSSVVTNLENLGDPKPRVFDQSNWNNAAIEQVKQQGAAAGPFVMYMASKTLAEQAAWNFIATHEGELPWDLVVLKLSYIFGVRPSQRWE